jgi:hypothetical protein
LDTIRIAKDIGDMALLLPEGVTSLYDLPYSIFEAVRIGLVFTSWDELPKEEKPPKSIWFDSAELRKHWKAVERMREQKFSGKGDGSDIRDQPIDGPTERNAMMDELYA